MRQWWYNNVGMAVCREGGYGSKWFGEEGV
jgi:hypothetical protein